MLQMWKLKTCCIITMMSLSAAAEEINSKVWSTCNASNGCDKECPELESIFLEKDIPLKKKNIVATLRKIYKEYALSFEVKPESYDNNDTWWSVIHLSSSNLSTSYGGRNPAVFFHNKKKGSMQICSAVNGYINYNFLTSPLPLMQWSTLKISQELFNGIYVFSITLNGTIIHSVVNNQTIEISNVNVYAGNPWNDSQNGSIRNFVVITGPSGIRHQWSAWSSCNVSCGYGSRIRTRNYCLTDYWENSTATSNFITCFSNDTCKVLSSYSELILQIIMNSTNFNSELFNMISVCLNDFKMLLGNPKISISNVSSGVVNVTVRYAKISDDNQLMFYQYMENNCFPTLYKKLWIKKVLVLCNGAYWEDANFSGCKPKSNTTKELISLIEIPTCVGKETNKNCLSPEVKIQKLNEIKTSKLLFTTHEDIVLVSNILDDVFMKSSAKINVTGDIFDMVNMILSTDSSLVILAQNTNNSSRKILQVLHVLANESTEEVKEFKLPYKKYSYEQFALTLAPAKYTDTYIQVNSQGEQDPSVNIMDKVSTSYQKRVDWNASVLIPRSALSLQDNVLFSFVFEKPTFFLSNNNSASLHFNQGEKRQNVTGIIVSSIISASVFNHSVKNLKKPIKLRFKKVDNKNLNGYLDCYFWNTTLESWSNAGCHKTFENSFEVRCECDHLTNFALILDTSQRGYNPLALQIVSWIGNVISLGALFLSILILVLFRKRCRQLSLKIHLQLCISLTALIVIFLAGAERRSKHMNSCRVIAGLLQYFILTTFLWTAVEAVSLYKNFVTVFHTVDPVKFLRIASLLAWGVPLLVVAISAGVAKCSFGDFDLCLLRGNAFFFGVLTPVSVILVSNFILLVLVMISLSTRRVETFVTNQEKIGIYRRILRSSRNAFALSTLLGLSWFFAIVAVEDAMELFQWLFCIFNSLQGLFLFVLYILRNDDLKEQVLTSWRSLSISSRNKSSSCSSTNEAFIDSINDSNVTAIKCSKLDLKNFS